MYDEASEASYLIATHMIARHTLPADFELRARSKVPRLPVTAGCTPCQHKVVAH